MTLLDRLIDPQQPDQTDKVPIQPWAAAMREHLRENPTGASGGGEVSEAQVLSIFGITDPAEIAALAQLKADILGGTLGMSVAALTQTISNNPSKAEIQAIQDKVNELILLLRTIMGVVEMLDILWLGEAGYYSKAQVAARLGV